MKRKVREEGKGRRSIKRLNQKSKEGIHRGRREIWGSGTHGRDKGKGKTGKRKIDLVVFINLEFPSLEVITATMRTIKKVHPLFTLILTTYSMTI